jgi:hypothetical protein
LHSPPDLYHVPEELADIASPVIMPAWIPLAKVALPVLAKVAEKAIPAFTGRRSNAKSLEEQSAQIVELEAAVTENAASIKVVAEQLEETVRSVDRGAVEMQAQMRMLATTSKRLRIIALCACAVALVALVVAMTALRA